MKTLTGQYVGSRDTPKSTYKRYINIKLRSEFSSSDSVSEMPSKRQRANNDYRKQKIVTGINVRQHNQSENCSVEMHQIQV